MDAAYKMLVNVLRRRRKAISGDTYSLDDIVNQFLGFVDLLFGVGHDQAVEIFFLVTGVSCIRAAFSFLDGSLSTDCNFGL
jgi:hypothetical protein